MEYEHFYPAAARRIMPHIDGALNTYAGMEITEDNLNRMSDDVVRRSMVAGDPPAGQSRNALNDIARILILQRLIDQGYNPFFFPFAPFYVFPGFMPSRPHNRFPHRR